jgi:hypothetical protein
MAYKKSGKRSDRYGRRTHEYAGSAKKREIGFGCDIVAGGAFFICRGG